MVGSGLPAALVTVGACYRCPQLGVGCPAHPPPTGHSPAARLPPPHTACYLRPHDKTYHHLGTRPQHWKWWKGPAQAAAWRLERRHVPASACAATRQPRRGHSPSSAPRRSHTRQSKHREMLYRMLHDMHAHHGIHMPRKGPIAHDRALEGSQKRRPKALQRYSQDLRLTGMAIRSCGYRLVIRVDEDIAGTLAGSPSRQGQSMALLLRSNSTS